MFPSRRRSTIGTGRRGAAVAALGAALLLVTAGAPAASEVHGLGDAVPHTAPHTESHEAPSETTGLPAPGAVAPVTAPIEVIRPFVRPEHTWSSGHRGVDLATEVGATVVSPVDGVVTFAGTVVDRGVLTVQDSHGTRSTVEPVSPLVRAGEKVARGQPVATVAPGHCTDRPCVHWGVRVGAAYVDPLDLLRRRTRIVLLPVPVARSG